MIFVSVGSMLPFNRLIRAADEWAAANPGQEIFLQIGRGDYEPQNAPWTRTMPVAEFKTRIRDCRLFVAHVGMGSILQALEAQRQTLLLPRHQSLGEHTTDHQLHTAARFRGTPGIRIVDDVDTLKSEMSRLSEAPLETGPAISPYASEKLLGSVRLFLEQAAGPAQP